MKLRGADLLMAHNLRFLYEDGDDDDDDDIRISVVKDD